MHLEMVFKAIKAGAVGLYRQIVHKCALSFWYLPAGGFFYLFNEPQARLLTKHHIVLV